MKNLFFLFFVLLGVFFTSHAQTTAPTAPPSSPLPPNLASPQGKVLPPAQVDIANEPTVRVAQNVMPAVVNITAQGEVHQDYVVYDSFFRRYRGIRSEPEKSIGSGLLISADGYIVTNAHVVALAQESVAITLSSQSKYTARILVADKDKDLALLKIEDKDVQFPYFDLSYVSPNLLGETAIALGSPVGYQNSVSQGIISAKGRSFTVEGRTFLNLVQTDAAINPGNSGGPLVDLNGSLIGINSAKLSGEAIESIGFAIPHEVVVPWVKEAMAVARGEKTASASTSLSKPLDVLKKRFGISVKNLTEAEADEMQINLPGGLIITGVEENSPAAEANLRRGMIIVAIGDHEITDKESLPKELESLESGGKARFHVVVVHKAGPFVMTRGGSALLEAR